MHGYTYTGGWTHRQASQHNLFDFGKPRTNVSCAILTWFEPLVFGSLESDALPIEPPPRHHHPCYCSMLGAFTSWRQRHCTAHSGPGDEWGRCFHLLSATVAFDGQCPQAEEKSRKSVSVKQRERGSTPFNRAIEIAPQRFIKKCPQSIVQASKLG